MKHESTIHKYSLEVQDFVSAEMPNDAELLTLQVQHGVPCIWARVPAYPTGTSFRLFQVFGTGHPIPADFSGNYVGTFQLEDGFLVFHVYEIPSGL